MDDTTQLDAFWERARRKLDLDAVPQYMGVRGIDVLRPPAWAFGSTPQQADELLTRVLDGRKTATASSAWDYEAEGEALPEKGTLGIVLDGSARPRALVVTTDVRVVPFEQVDADHAAAEGEGDGSLEHWRLVHEDHFTRTGARRFADDMPVVLEDFEVVHQEP